MGASIGVNDTAGSPPWDSSGSPPRASTRDGACRLAGQAPSAPRGVPGSLPRANSAVGLLVLLGEREYLGDVPVCVVVGEDRAGQARRSRATGRAEVAGGGRHRVEGV